MRNVLILYRFTPRYVREKSTAASLLIDYIPHRKKSQSNSLKNIQKRPSTDFGKKLSKIFKKALDKLLKRLYNMVYDYGTDIA